MFEGLLFFISAGIVCELAAINRNLPQKYKATGGIDSNFKRKP